MFMRIFGGDEQYARFCLQSIPYIHNSFNYFQVYAERCYDASYKNIYTKMNLKKSTNP